MAKRTPWPHRFWDKTMWRDGCLVWTGHCTGGGYGRTFFEGKQVYAHRVAFMLIHGRWPNPELVLRHTCNNPPCVVHVVEGTQRENIADSLAAGTQAQARKTHCPQGHPYDEANTYRPPSKPHTRQCRACQRIHRANRVRRAA